MKQSCFEAFNLPSPGSVHRQLFSLRGLLHANKHLQLKQTEHVPAYKNLEHSVLHYDCTFLANGLPVIVICNDNPFEFGLFARHAARRKAVETQIENFVSNIEQCLRKVGYPIFEARPCYNCANIFIKKGDVVQTVAQNKRELKLSKLTVTIGTFHHKLS